MKSACAYCGKPAEGNYAIHRDGFGVGPEVDLCDACGGGAIPTCRAIWNLIAQPSSDDFAHVRRTLTGHPLARIKSLT